MTFGTLSSIASSEAYQGGGADSKTRKQVWQECVDQCQCSPWLTPVWQECVDQYQFFEWMTPFLNEPLSFRTQTLVVTLDHTP
ncbi:hypothetical protein T484DRAFT_1857061 [Baffinella frigidus]|nr:hypothetical protein T484DRAFT_1857061 [Cryptophyta sp. CCMP2293]